MEGNARRPPGLRRRRPFWAAGRPAEDEVAARSSLQRRVCDRPRHRELRAIISNSAVPAAIAAPVRPKRLPADWQATWSAMGRVGVNPRVGESDGARWWMTEAESLPYSPELDARYPDQRLDPRRHHRRRVQRRSRRCALRGALGGRALGDRDGAPSRHQKCLRRAHHERRAHAGCRVRSLSDPPHAAYPAGPDSRWNECTRPIT